MDNSSDNDPINAYWCKGEDCCNPQWEAAYNRFESRKEERRKFRARLIAMGINGMPRTMRVADLFCGRGSNLDVLEELGFTDITGVDLSPTLLKQYKGKARLYVGDCRELKLENESMDLIIVQGGLHHLPTLPDDLEKVFREIHRVLSPSGIVAFVEPALTPFLRLAHFCCSFKLLGKVYPRLGALATMIDYEKTTYYNWLSRPMEIRDLACRFFDPVLNRSSFGKWYFLGQKLPQDEVTKTE